MLARMGKAMVRNGINARLVVNAGKSGRELSRASPMQWRSNGAQTGGNDD